MLREQIESVRQRITAAARRAHRDPSAITLVCVTKETDPRRVCDALAVGVRDLGENRVQEARAKQDAVRALLEAGGGFDEVRWHLIGHLQRNKANQAAALFDVIHSVDSVELVDALERAAGRRKRPLDIMVQVNVSGETTKFGCRPEEAPRIAQRLLQGERLRWHGLMTMAPLGDEAAAARPHFRRLRELRDQLAAEFHRSASSLHLSMGMSADFEVAIEEGADLVRVGAAIFGPRARDVERGRAADG